MQNIFDLLSNLPDLIGFYQLVAIVLGLLIGMIVGVLPGIGPLLGVVMAIPFTFYMQPVSAMALLIGIYQGGAYGGAIASTMIGIPGTPMAAATLLDARPMALNGKASVAVTLSTLGSSFGGVLSAIILIATASQLAAIALKFGPAETAAFAFLGLTTLGALSGGTAIKGWMMGALGLFFAVIGRDPISGVARYTFDTVYLEGGITLVPLLVGMFSISEILMQIENPARAHDVDGDVSASSEAFRSLIMRPVNYVRSSLIGVFVGILPGVGGVTASYMSYRVAMLFRKKQDPDFGQGNSDGVIACETANSAVTGGALIPMLALSIPGDPIVAVLMGGLMLQGVQPGAMMFIQHGDVVSGIFLSFLVTALLLLPLGLLFIRGAVQLLHVPQWAVMTGVLLLSLVGTYSISQQIHDLTALLVFGAIGYLLRKRGFPLAPVVIGFVLGPIFETNFRRMSLISQGDIVGYIADRPITLAALGLALVFLIFPLISMILRKSNGGPAAND